MAKITRVERLQRKLQALPRIARQEIEKAMEKSAAEMVTLARSLVPVDSGDLRQSIGWTWGEAPKGSIRLGTVGGGAATITIFAGNSEAFYARWVEFGTQKMRAQPYFFPAYRALRKRAKSRIRRAGTKAAKKVAAS